MKKIIAFILTAAALLSLCACGASPAAGQDGTAQGAAAGSSQAGTAAEGGEVEYELSLVAEYLDLPSGMEYATAQCRLGNTVWLGGPAESGAVLGSVSLDDGEAGGLVELPEGCESVYAMCPHGENLMALAGSSAEYYEDEQGEASEGVQGQLWLLEFDGSEFVSRTELDRLYTDVFRSMLELDGSFYILSRYALIRLGADGSETAQFEHGENAAMLSMRFFGGELVALAIDFDSFGPKLYRLDAQTLSLSGEVDHSDGPWIYNGMGIVDDALVVDNGRGVYALDGDFQLGDAVFDWEELFISGEFQEIEQLDDGYLFFTPYQEQVCLARWRETRVRKTVVMATDASYGQAFTVASDFNRSQDEYFVQVKVYEAYEEEGALMRLQTEIGAGNWPDVFAFNLSDTLAEMRDELTLENLYDYIDADPALSREELMEPVLRAMEKDGALYWLPWKFWMLTLVGPESLVGQAGISVEDTLRIAGENGLVPIEQWVTREMLLETYSAAAIRQFVDWDNGTCSFDSEGFADILKLCGEMFASADVTADNGNLYTGPHDAYLLMRYFVSDPAQSAWLNRSTGGDYCFAGFPGAQGNGSLFYLPLRLAITAGAPEKEGAWAFLSFLMSEEEQSAEVAGSANGLSVNAAVFERKLENMLKGDYTNPFGDKEELADADARRLRELIYGAELVVGADPVLEKIISDCAAPYFAGEKSAEEAARDIQARAAIYVGERG